MPYEVDAVVVLYLGTSFGEIRIWPILFSRILPPGCPEDAADINTMRRGIGRSLELSYSPIRLKRSFIWSAQQARCGTAA